MTDEPGALDPVARRLGTDTASRLRSVSTATLTSQLRKRGLSGCIFDGLHRFGREHRLVGFARTVRYLPLREDLFADRAGGFNAQKRAVDGIEPGDVLVISARGVPDAGTIGDILALRTQVLGGGGIITDGAVRDAAVIDELDIATFALGHHPAPLGVRHVPWETDVAVACAGVLVEPGDLLVGDDDGLVLLPAAIIDSIALDSVAQEDEERFIAGQVAAGESVDGLYPMNAEWRAKFEQHRNG